METLPRLRQAVLAAAELEPVTTRLRQSLSLGEPFSDPGVGYFGLRNAVFAIGDTFLEVVSPTRPNTSAGRLLERRGGDCGYMVMFEVDDLRAARERAAANGVREVFEVEYDDISEVHLHPADMAGAIVALSEPRPHGAWRWGGPDWEGRSVAGAVERVTIEVPDVDTAAARWKSVIGGLPGMWLNEGTSGPVEIAIRGRGEPLQIGSVRVSCDTAR